MNLLNILGLKKDEKPAPAPVEKPAQDGKKTNPHAHGGCCGSCGGQDKR